MKTNKGIMKTNTRKNKNFDPQVEYQGRWVNPNVFRVYVYSVDGSEKLANSYPEFKELISSGLWFETKETAVSIKKGKPKDDSVRSNS